MPNVQNFALVLAFAVGVLWALTLNSSSELEGILRHLPALLGLLALMLHALKYRVRAVIQSFRRPEATPVLYFTALGTFVLVGAGIARLVHGVEAGFLNLGVYMLLCPIAYLTVLSPKWRWKNSEVMQKILLAVAVVAVIAQLVTAQEGLLHNQEHLVLGGLFYAAHRWRQIRTLAWIAMVVASVAMHKNTAYLVLLTFALIEFGGWLARATAGRSAAYKASFVALVGLILAALLGALAALFLVYRDSLPTGNAEFRLHTYARAFNRFLDSPLFGRAFTGAASEEFDLFEVAASTQNLPTHSDILDILAGGGLLAAAMLVCGLCALSRNLYRYGSGSKIAGMSRSHVEARAAYCFAAIPIAAVVTSAFNPVLNSPAAAPIWVAAGIACALRARISG